MKVCGSKNDEKFAYLRLIKDGDTVFDIGANVGYYTILFSHVVGPKGQVHAFEPVPSTFELLQQRAQRERAYSNIFLNRCVACDVDGKTFDIFVPGDDHGQASLAVHTAGSWAGPQLTRRFQCNGITLDRYVEDNRVKKIDFIKIDVEGAELLVLIGARKTLSVFQPVILFEFSEQWTRDFHYSLNDIVRLLTQVGYGFYYLEDFRQLVDPVEQLRSVESSTNVICAATRLA